MGPLDVLRCIRRTLTLPIVLGGLWIIVFLLLDAYLYVTVTSLPDGTTLPILMNGTTEGPYCTSPFCVINVKILMKGPFPLYFEQTLVMKLARALNLANSFLFITPNQISFLALIIALIANYNIAQDSLRCRRLGVILSYLRETLDELDGTMVRVRKEHRSVEDISIQDSTMTSNIGFWFDGFADAIALVGLHIACFVFLMRRRNFSYHTLPRVATSPPTSSDATGRPQIKRSLIVRHSNKVGREIARCFSHPFMLVLLHGISMSIACLGWNKFILRYTEHLQQIPGDREIGGINKAVLLKSPWTWIVFLLWRYFNPLNMVEYLLFAIFFDKMGPFLYNLRFYGLAIILIAFGVTELHSYLIQMHYFC